jgi:hypothetical protein
VIGWRDPPLNNASELTSIALLWIAMVPAAIATIARRRGSLGVANFCEGMAWGLTLSDLTLLAVTLL